MQFSLSLISGRFGLFISTVPPLDVTIMSHCNLCMSGCVERPLF